MSVNVKSLIGKLNDTTRNAMQAAAGFCLQRTHYDVEIEHFLMKLLENSGGDLAAILKAFEVDKSKLAAQLTASLDKLKSGNARNPVLAPTLVKMLGEAWSTATLDFGAGNVRTGFCILALAQNEELSRLMGDISREFKKIDAKSLQDGFDSICGASYESSEMKDLGEARSAAAGASAADGAPRVNPASKTPNLDAYTINLTENARIGKIDTVLARDWEIRQVIDILTRRRQNNPILVGEAGVGKTAVVEGLALRIVAGDVPPPLKDVKLHTLDLALLQAGASVKGEFENRLKGLIDEVKRSPTPIILFIDEAHTMIGAGGQAGQNDAANLLKPALARGELRTVAATTWAEYKKYFEKDPALTRRFQTVKVDEPSEYNCQLMLRGILPMLEKHHNVLILDEGLAAAVKLSARYLPDRQLPDKAVSVLDTACARLALGQSSIPPAVEAVQREIGDYEVQTRVLNRENEIGVSHFERLAEIAHKREAAEEKLKLIQARWEAEGALVREIRQMREQIMSNADGVDKNGLRESINAKMAELNALQGESPLMRVSVDAQVVGEVIAAWTGIPIGKMLKDEIQTILDLEKHLCARVIGQDHAMHAIAERVRTNKAGMDDPVKPVGVFMLVGPSGVGKTETALALADLLYGGEDNMITINMSEFQEAHTVSTLKGSPPGYVGYGEGGVLTEAVRRRPYSVVLLDEVEKAHPDVLELFFQVFDKGRMEDGEGREIIFRNSIIILTSNAATDTLMKLVADPETMPSPEGIITAMKPELDKVFKPAFLGRMVIIPYYPVRDEVLKTIVKLKLGKIQKRLKATHKIELAAGADVIDAVAARCTEVESGARNVDNILTNTLLPDISRRLLNMMAEGMRPETITVSAGADGNFQYA
ncbi:MAG: type VI secretion system ATPase TssH [Bryobacter sp.]|jgi:type VI secretion system protein VasG|nr:type VI secretion system ATPase TssH [Bryobacter sp. CoA8 C33]